MAQLIRNVIIDGNGWGPGYGNADAVPAEVAARIRNPDAWAAAPDGEPVEPTAPEEQRQPIEPATADAIVEATEHLQAAVLLDQLAQLPDDKPVLAAFADEHDIEVDNRLGAPKMRAALVEALQAHGDVE